MSNKEEIKFDNETSLKEFINQHFEEWWKQCGPEMVAILLNEGSLQSVALSAYQGGFCEGYFTEVKELKRVNEKLKAYCEEKEGTIRYLKREIELLKEQIRQKDLEDDDYLGMGW